jgi:hypothetical protein
MTEEYKPPITPPPPRLLKKFSAQAQDETKKRNGAGYLKTFATLCIEWAMNSKATSNDRQIRSSEIQPPPELVQQWWLNNNEVNCVDELATRAAQWGADQELEACCEWFADDVVSEVVSVVAELRAARRPKAPSLKEQALEAQQRMWHGTSKHDDWNLIRRALEALDD